MLLSVKERILLFSLLPVEGDITSLRAVRRLREELAFSDQENQELKIQQAGPTYHWDPLADKPKQIDFPERALDLVAASLKRLNENGALTIDHVDLWDKFVSPNGEDG